MKAIETRYAGCRFRSRLEARWAVFLDAMEIRWEYEPEGFETSAGWYLPDFRVDPSCIRHETSTEFFGPTFGDAYLEVKGGPLTREDALKIKAFACDLGKPRWVMALGSIPRPFSGTDLTLPGWGMRGAGRCDVRKGELCNFAMHSPVDSWNRFRPELMDRSFHANDNRLFVDLGSYHNEFFLGAPVNRALAAARSARFEHGESPSW